MSASAAQGDHNKSVLSADFNCFTQPFLVSNPFQLIGHIVSLDSLTLKDVATFEVVDYSEEKTIEKLQKFVNGIVTSPPAMTVCLIPLSSLNSCSVFHAVLLFITPFISEHFQNQKCCSHTIDSMRYRIRLRT